MVAYSFRPRFVAPIRVGLGLPPISANATALVPAPKRQTIRAHRRGRGRHVRPGEQIQLYTGMRTKYCVLIGRGRCKDVRDIIITFGEHPCVAVGGTGEPERRRKYQPYACYQGGGLDDFARRDGFASWNDMAEFWRAEHGDLDVFTGVLIEWEPLT